MVVKVWVSKWIEMGKGEIEDERVINCKIDDVVYNLMSVEEVLKSVVSKIVERKLKEDEIVYEIRLYVKRKR